MAYLSVYLPVCLPTYLPVCLPTCLPDQILAVLSLRLLESSTRLGRPFVEASELIILFG